MQSFEIIPTKSIGEIAIGMEITEIIVLLGEPENSEITEEPPFPKTKIVSYYEMGIYLFFTIESKESLNVIETDNDEALLWGYKIFMMDEVSLIKLFNSKGYVDPEIELHSWGEKRYSFENIGLDLFFENNTLVSVSITAPFIKDDQFSFSLN